MFEGLVDEISLGVCFETHRAAKYGYLFMDESPAHENNKYMIIDKKGYDIFGQLPMKKQHECVCPNCGRNLAASRFAPHLEKCMGMGRNSSRIASRRIANTSAKNESDAEEYDNNADSDWNYYCSDGKKKRKREKNGNRKADKKSSKVHIKQESPSDGNVT